MKTLLKIVLTICVSIISLNCFAQKANVQQKFVDDDVKLEVDPSPHPGRFHLKSVENLYDKTITVIFKNEYDNHETPIKLSKGKKEKYDLTFTVALAKPVKGGEWIQIYPYNLTKQKDNSQTDTPPIAADKKETDKDKKDEPKSDDKSDKDKKEVGKDKTDNQEKATKDKKEEKKEDKKDDKKKDEKNKDTKDDKSGKGKDDSKPDPKQPSQPEKSDANEVETPTPVIEKVDAKTVIAEFQSMIDTIPVYSLVKIAEDSIIIVGHLDNLRNWSDKAAYIKDKGIVELIKAQKDTIEQARNSSAVLIDNFLKRYEGKELIARNSCVANMKSILSERLAAREKNLKLLEDEITEQPSSEGINWKVIGVSAVAVILMIALLLWYRKTKKKQAQPVKKPENTISTAEASSLIVVRQRTAPTLKKQSLDDVYHNEAYLKIDCKDFCTDSCVRTMYIKNTCIKDIYNMYAEDLRNPANPKEDGCLVIGRWVQNTATNEYDVSLEYVILPGDDAVFTEYELNFGGKIQIKKADVLKRLRRDTGLQYDLTCWVHSHPGLGVFFSNSDNNVQMQLKQELHPNVLTAMVIDILTPNQETGIFTFKSDSMVNSKNDLTRMYSLEEMYRWALDSERRSFNKDDYYNALGNADRRIGECYGIELSNGAIIDMTYLTANQNGYVGLVHGYPIRQGDKMEYITTSVTKSEAVSDSEVIGCFVVAAHCSIPSIRKLMAQYLDKIKFVLVYTATDGLLTSIPVLSRDLCGSEDYYGENNLEDLKIWTRRRR